MAEALATLVTLTRLNHDILAKDTVKECVMRLVISWLYLRDLTFSQRYLPLQDQRTSRCNASDFFWNKFWDFFGVFMD